MKNCIVTVKEREVGKPCFLLVELHEDIGLAENQHIAIEMPKGSSFEDAQRAKKVLNDLEGSIHVKSL